LANSCNGFLSVIIIFCLSPSRSRLTAPSLILLQGWAQCLKPVILITLEVEIRRIMVQG
jgi:hypothetical protein